MTTWKKKKTYCRTCNKWYCPLEHRNCPMGQSGSLIVIDLETHIEGCTKCKRTWTLDTSGLSCWHCGQNQNTAHQDSTLLVQSGRTVAAVSSNAVAVARQVSTSAVG